MDVENYGIKLSMTGDAQVNKQFDTVAATGEQSAQRVTSAFSQTSASIARMSAPMVTFRKQVDDANAAMARMAPPAVSGFRQIEAAVTRMSAPAVTFRREIEAVTRMAAPAVTGFRQMAIAEEQAAQSAGVHGLQLGRVNMELGTAAGRILGMNTATTRFAAMLGGAVAGYGEMILIVGVIVAASAAYEKLTESTRKAEEEQKKLNDALDEYLKKQGRPAGDIGGATTALVDQNEQYTRQIAALRAQKAALAPEVAIEQGNALENQIIALNRLFDANAVKIGAARGEQERLTKASHEHVNELALQVEKQEALNAAFNHGSYAVARINLDYDHRLALLHNAAEYTGAELVAINKLTDAQYAASLTAAALANAEDELQKSMDGADKAGTKILDTLKNTQAEWTLNERAYQRLRDELKELNAAHDGEIEKIGKESEARAKAQVNAAADAIKAAQKFSNDMNNIWRSSVGKIATDGLKSFQDFFEDVNQLFTRLLARMEAEGKANGIAGKLLGFGAAAVGGAAIGYASQSPGIGAVGGALAGSAYGPYGALIGGLAGLTGGLLGGAQAAKQRRDAEEQLRASLEASARDIQHQMGTITDLAAAIADAEAQRQAALKADLEAYGDFRSKFTGKNDGSVTAALTATNKLYDDYIEWLKKQAEATKEATQAAKDAANETSRQNSHLRLLNANGQSDAAFQYQQSLELEKAIADGLSGIALSELIQAQWAEAAQREREKQTQILQDQLSAAQQAVDALQQVYDSLDQFSKSLNIGQYSPLSPRQKLDATRGQLGALYQAALGGDQQAAGQFSGVAQQFLDASRKYNASGAGYVLDFNSVSVMVDALKSKFGAQLTDAQKQVSLLQQQLDALKSIDNGIQTLVNRPGLVPQVPTPTPVGGGGGLLQPIVGITADAQVSAAGFQIVADKLDALTDAVESGNNTTRRSIDSLTSATLKAS